MIRHSFCQRTPWRTDERQPRHILWGDISCCHLFLCFEELKEGPSKSTHLGETGKTHLLAHLGTDGLHSGHVARDLDVCLGMSVLQDAMISLPLRTKNGRGFLEVHKVILPHRLFAAMWNNGSEDFEYFWYGAGKMRLKSFWQSLPIEKRPRETDLETTIPLKLFGDGVAVLGISKTWGKTVQSYILSSMLAGAEGRSSQVLLTLLWKNKLPHESYRKWWRCLTWSLKSLHSGTWPDRDMFDQPYPEGSLSQRLAGTPLAGHYKAHVLALTGDLEFIHTGYELQSPNSLQPCSRCNCNSSTRPWTDTRSPP